MLDLHCCFLWLQQAGTTPRLWCVGFSLRWLLLLQSMEKSAQASAAAARSLGSCVTLAQSPHNMWNLPRPEIEPTSSPLAGGLLTTGPPGQSGSYFFFFNIKISSYLYWIFAWNPVGSCLSQSHVGFLIQLSIFIFYSWLWLLPHLLCFLWEHTLY